MSLGLKGDYKIKRIAVDDIVKAPDQPRKIFDEESIENLAMSISENGIIQPVVVRKLQNKKYEIIAGERRVRAAKKASLTTVPCIVMDCNDDKAMVLSLIENIQRQNLDPFEEAFAIKNLLKNDNVRQEDIARQLGKSQSSIANKLRLLQLDKDEIDIIRQAKLTERHSRALIKVKDKVQRLKLIDIIVSKKLNVAQTEKLIDESLNQVKKPKKKILIKDVRIFLNTISKAVNLMKESGINAESVKNETDDYIECTIKIPKIYGTRSKKS